MEQGAILSSVFQELQELKSLIKQGNNSPMTAVTENWMPRDQLMKFLGYESTQMAAFLKSGKVVVSKIGKRVFISRKSIEKLLESSVSSAQSSNT
jgi:hypothetical protein